MEKQRLDLVFGEKALEQLKSEFANGNSISYEFDDYILKFAFDPTVSDEQFLIHKSTGRRLETQHLMQYDLPHSYFPEDITRVVRLSYAEAVRCYESACFLGCIALCGRTIETVLGALYEKKVGVHPTDDPAKPGMNAIINRLTKKGYTFPAGLKEKMGVIALHRNMAVHGNLVIPTDDEARSVVYSTRDVLQITAQ